MEDQNQTLKMPSEIQLTARIGDLLPKQVEDLCACLKHFHNMTLRDAGLGRYWLEEITQDSGALLINPRRTVGDVCQYAELVAEARAAFDSGNVLEWLEKRA